MKRAQLDYETRRATKAGLALDEWLTRKNQVIGAGTATRSNKISAANDVGKAGTTYRSSHRAHGKLASCDSGTGSTTMVTNGDDSLTHPITADMAAVSAPPLESAVSPPRMRKLEISEAVDTVSLQLPPSNPTMDSGPTKEVDAWQSRALNAEKRLKLLRGTKSEVAKLRRSSKLFAEQQSELQRRAVESERVCGELYRNLDELNEQIRNRNVQNENLRRQLDEVLALKSAAEDRFDRLRREPDRKFRLLKRALHGELYPRTHPADSTENILKQAAWVIVQREIDRIENAE